MCRVVESAESRRQIRTDRRQTVAGRRQRALSRARPAPRCWRAARRRCSPTNCGHSASPSRPRRPSRATACSLFASMWARGARRSLRRRLTGGGARAGDEPRLRRQLDVVAHDIRRRRAAVGERRRALARLRTRLTRRQWWIYAAAGGGGCLLCLIIVVIVVCVVRGRGGGSSKGNNNGVPMTSLSGNKAFCAICVCFSCFVLCLFFFDVFRAQPDGSVPKTDDGANSIRQRRLFCGSLVPRFFCMQNLTEL